MPAIFEGGGGTLGDGEAVAGVNKKEPIPLGPREGTRPQHRRRLVSGRPSQVLNTFHAKKIASCGKMSKKIQVEMVSSSRFLLYV